MALMAAHGEITPIPEAAIFADTGAEPLSVYKHLDALEKLLPFPVYRVTAGNLELDSLVNRVSRKTGQIYTKNLIPFFIDKYTGGKSLMMRKCTADYKVKVLQRKVKELVKPPRGCKEVKVIQWIGISIDEAHRMKPSNLPWIEHRWPLIEAGISREDCIKWMVDKGYPKPPRSACVFCPYHNDREWLRLKNEEPQEFERAVQFEKNFQEAHTHQSGTARLNGIAYLHGSCVPLGQVQFKEHDPKNQLNLFGNECEGMCGV
jgi:hypothetical protein